MKNLLPLFLISLLISCDKTQKQKEYETLDHTLYFGDTEAGYFKSTQIDEDTYKYIFEYNDRGRGPHLEETIKLNDSGIPSSIEILGHNYLKDTVAEKFSISQGQAEWKSNSEQGNIDVTAPAFYTGVNSSFGNTELLVQKLINNPEKSLKLYPEGEVSISEIQEITIQDTLDLKLVELTGFSFSPNYIWLDQNNRFFAAPSTWLTAIREGYKSVKDELLEIQTKRQKEYYQNTANLLTLVPQGNIVISNVNIFDSNEGKIIPNKHVVIAGNKIEDILDGSQPIPENSRHIDGTGKTLLPGLFDMHTHLDRSDGILNLAAGITSVRDLANSFDLPEIRDDFNEGKVLGPRILVISGFIDQAGPYAGPIGKIVSTLEEGLDAVDYYKEREYDQIKLYSSIDPEWVKPLAEKAHQEGLKVSGHIPAYMNAEQAIKDGYDEIQHINMVALNFMSDTIDTRTPLRFSMIGEHAHAIDLSGEEFQSFIKLLQEEDIVIDPTVSIFEGMLTTKAGDPNPQFMEILDRLPIQVRRGFYTGGLPIPDGKEQQYKDSFQKLLGMIKALYDAGVTIVPGTDAMSGFSLHKELENYVRAGIPEEEVLKMATITSARVTGDDNQLGSIEEGKLADLILVDGDPTENISDIRRVELTIKDGNIYDAEKLYQAIGVKHFK